jgi:hypothetical protein
VRRAGWPWVAVLWLLALSCGDGSVQQLRPELQPPLLEYDFGEVPVLNERKLTLTLQNHGRAALSLVSLRLREETVPFRVGRYPAEVPRGGQETVDLFFKPTAEQDFAGTVLLQTDDPERPFLELSLKGVGLTRAVMEVTPRHLYFERTPEGGASVQTLTIRSHGTADLILEELSFTGDTTPGFSFVGSTRTPAVVRSLGPDGRAGEVQLTVKYQVAQGAPEHASGGVRIRNTDPDQPEVVVPLTGRVNRAPLPHIAPVPNAAPGMTVRLDGSGSTDPDNDLPLTYEWALVRKPAGAQASLASPTSAVATLKLDDVLPGEYEVALHVTDSASPSPARSLTPARLRIVATPAQQLLVEMFRDNAETDLDLHLLKTPTTALFNIPGVWMATTSGM